MGCRVMTLDDGREVDVHAFDDRRSAVHFLTVGRGYRFDRCDVLTLTETVDFYQGPHQGERALLREFPDYCRVAFWTNGA